ncbi:hypothetical protein ARALYDRAFT_917711 [Arabidopsis lyrata subsp. lyrata]|uniref:Uncharacterized protein n=1 Tax=Arabidopsis lyrata subsp. lyrata TaxID=81972 RepID=D7ML36_ARALL|nr:hypothetical protein ARALYDRAFT_917711 [Arabidopsis lyrata subsp. lyrata]
MGFDGLNQIHIKYKLNKSFQFSNQNVDQQVLLPSSSCMHRRIRYSSAVAITATFPNRLLVINRSYSRLCPGNFPIYNKWTVRGCRSFLLPCLLGLDADCIPQMFIFAPLIPPSRRLRDHCSKTIIVP